MKKLLFVAVLCLFGVQVFAQEKTKDFTPNKLASFADFSWMSNNKFFINPNSKEEDVRSSDLSKYDLSSLPPETLNKLSFDDKTIWPKKMPKWLNIKKIKKIGKTPGLNIKKLHKQGINGKGVNIAIIDQPLSSHQEYNKNLVFYKDFTNSQKAPMHGAAVASIAVGKNVGVAPKAKLYHIAANFSYYNEEKQIFNDTPIAEAIEYLLELNKTLPEKDKFFVISISRGFDEQDYGREKFLATLEKAKKQGVLVLTTNDVFTISREGYYANPDEISSYTKPAYWWQEEELHFYTKIQDICVPTDYRVIASPTGEKDYVAYSKSGLSWAVPYLAGIAALAKQVKPDLTPEEFLETAHKTTQSVEVKNKSGQSIENKNFINPQALIEKLQKEKLIKEKL